MRTARSLAAAALALSALACRSGEVVTPTPHPFTREGLAPLAHCFDARGASDLDADGLSGMCEEALANAFAPVLMQDPDDCEWTRLEPTAFDSQFTGIAGGYFHAVQHVADDRVRIAYLPAYRTDCGWEGAKCILPGVDCDAHAGDSEAIIVDVEWTAEGWRPVGVFLSAHCFDGDSTECRWYRDEELGAFDWDGARPVVWVSAGRHANYPSRRACERGHYHLDTCDEDARPVRFRVPGRNVGSVSTPAPCTPESNGVAECVWSGEPFRGWQRDAPGVTPYLRYLDEIGGFVTPLDRLRWLAGCWAQTSGNTLTEEQWMVPRGGMMLGMGRVVRGGVTVAHEAMRIEARGDALVFVAHPSGQQTAEFVASSVGDSAVVFSNPEHDFPQRVIYRHAAGESLHVRIEGLSDGVLREVDFRMERAQCGA